MFNLDLYILSYLSEQLQYFQQKSSYHKHLVFCEAYAHFKDGKKRRLQDAAFLWTGDGLSC